MLRYLGETFPRSDIWTETCAAYRKLRCRKLSFMSGIKSGLILLGYPLLPVTEWSSRVRVGFNVSQHKTALEELLYLPAPLQGCKLWIKVSSFSWRPFQFHHESTKFIVNLCALLSSNRLSFCLPTRNHVEMCYVSHGSQFSFRLVVRFSSSHFDSGLGWPCPRKDWERTFCPNETFYLRPRANRATHGGQPFPNFNHCFNGSSIDVQIEALNPFYSWLQEWIACYRDQFHAV